MKKIILPKGQGKTIELIKMSADNKWYIVCHSIYECSRIHCTAMEMNLKIPFPITYDEFINGKYYGKGIRGFLVDNVDLLVQHIAGVTPIIALTITN